MHPRRGGVWLVWLDASLAHGICLKDVKLLCHGIIVGTTKWWTVAYHYSVFLMFYSISFFFFVHFFQSQPIVTLKTSNFQVKNDTILICTMSILVGKIMHAALCAHAILSAEHQHSIWNNNVMQWI